MPITQLPAPKESKQGGPISADWNNIIDQINERIAGDYGSSNGRPPSHDILAPSYQLPSTWNRVWGFLDLMLQMCNNYGASIDRYNLPLAPAVLHSLADGLTKRIFDLMIESLKSPFIPIKDDQERWHRTRVKQRKAFTSVANDFFEWKNAPHQSRETDFHDTNEQYDNLQGYGHIWTDDARFSARPNAKIMGELLSLWVGTFANGTEPDKTEPYKIKNIALPFQQLLDEKQFRIADIYTYKELDENGDPALDEDGNEIIHEEVEINNADPIYTHEDEEPTDENPEPKKYRIFEIIGKGKYRLINDDDEENDPITKEIEIDGYLWLGDDEGGWRIVAKNDAVDDHEAKVILLEPRKATYADACLMAFMFLAADPRDTRDPNVDHQTNLWRFYFSDSVLARDAQLMFNSAEPEVTERTIDVGNPPEESTVTYPSKWHFPTVLFRKWLIDRFGNFDETQTIDRGVINGVHQIDWTTTFTATLNADKTELTWTEDYQTGTLAQEYLGEIFKRWNIKDDTEFAFKRNETAYKGTVIDKKFELEEGERRWTSGSRFRPDLDPPILPYVTFKLDKPVPAGVDAPAQWVRLLEKVVEDDPPNDRAERTDTRAYALIFNEAYMYLRCIATAFCSPETRLVKIDEDGEYVDVAAPDCDGGTFYVVRDLTVERYAQLLGVKNFGGEDNFGVLPNTKYDHEVMTIINDAVNKLSHIRVMGITLNVRVSGADYINIGSGIIKSEPVGQPQAVLANIHDYINGDTDDRRGSAFWRPVQGSWSVSDDGFSWVSNSFPHPGLVGTATPIPTQTETDVSHFVSSTTANTQSLRIGASNGMIYVGSEMEVGVYEYRLNNPQRSIKYTIEFNQPLFRHMSTAGQRTLTISINPTSLRRLGSKITPTMRDWLIRNALNNVIIRISKNFTGDNPTEWTCRFGGSATTFDLQTDGADPELRQVVAERLVYPSHVDQYEPPRPVRHSHFVAMALSHNYANANPVGSRTFTGLKYDPNWDLQLVQPLRYILYFGDSGDSIPASAGNPQSPVALVISASPLSTDIDDFQRYSFAFNRKRAIAVDGRAPNGGPIQAAVPIS